MSELSCGTRFIGRNETLDLSLYQCFYFFYFFNSGDRIKRARCCARSLLRAPTVTSVALIAAPCSNLVILEAETDLLVAHESRTGSRVEGPHLVRFLRLAVEKVDTVAKGLLAGIEAPAAGLPVAVDEARQLLHAGECPR